MPCILYLLLFIVGLCKVYTSYANFSANYPNYPIGSAIVVAPGQAQYTLPAIAPKENDVMMLCLPPHTTLEAQPLHCVQCILL